MKQSFSIEGSIRPSVKTEKKHHINALATLIAKFKARRRYNALKKSLKEVELIEAGKKKPKTLNQLLNEL